MEEKFEDLVIIGNIENVLYEMEETQVTRLVKFRIGLLARIENCREEIAKKLGSRPRVVHLRIVQTTRQFNII